jgi:hypothetical protein
MYSTWPALQGRPQKKVKLHFAKRLSKALGSSKSERTVSDGSSSLPTTETSTITASVPTVTSNVNYPHVVTRHTSGLVASNPNSNAQNTTPSLDLAIKAAQRALTFNIAKFGNTITTISTQPHAQAAGAGPQPKVETLPSLHRESVLLHDTSTVKDTLC